jgi:hypothetical protein
MAFATRNSLTDRLSVYRHPHCTLYCRPTMSKWNLFGITRIGPFVQSVQVFQECHARTSIPEEAAVQDSVNQNEADGSGVQDDNDDNDDDENEQGNKRDVSISKKRSANSIKSRSDRQKRQAGSKEQQGSSKEQQGNTDGRRQRRMKKQQQQPEALPKHVLVLRKAARGKLSPKYKVS